MTRQFPRPGSVISHTYPQNAIAPFAAILVPKGDASLSRPFDPQARSFGALLGQYNETRQIVVPEFQRGYSWEKEHVSEFWSDISEFHQEKTKTTTASKKYFAGPIVVLPENDSLLLLDGQQRLATATILFSVIRDIARSIGNENAMYLARDIQRDLISKDTENQKYALILFSFLSLEMEKGLRWAKAFLGLGNCGRRWGNPDLAIAGGGGENVLSVREFGWKWLKGGGIKSWGRV